MSSHTAVAVHGPRPHQARSSQNRSGAVRRRNDRATSGCVGMRKIGHRFAVRVSATRRCELVYTQSYTELRRLGHDVGSSRRPGAMTHSAGRDPDRPGDRSSVQRRDRADHLRSPRVARLADAGARAVRHHPPPRAARAVPLDADPRLRALPAGGGRSRIPAASRSRTGPAGPSGIAT